MRKEREIRDTMRTDNKTETAKAPKLASLFSSPRKAEDGFGFFAMAVLTLDGPRPAC